MKVSQVVIKDLEKLIRKSKKVKSIRELAIKSKINYVYLINAKNGKHIMSEEKWNEIKKFL